MDLNLTDILFPDDGRPINSYGDIGRISDCGKTDNLGDTALRLDCLGYRMSKTAKISNPQRNHNTPASDDGCRLVLGLGPMPSSYLDDYYPIGATKIKESATLFSQLLAADSDCEILKLGLSRGTEEIRGPHENAVSAQTEPHQSYFQNQLPANGKRILIPVVDEGSTSAKRKSGGYMPSLLMAPRLETSKNLPETRELLESGASAEHHLQFSPGPSASTECSVGTFSEPMTAAALSDHRSHHPKKCRFKGCSKGARGASGLCIAHGGGQRCQKPGCNKGAESRTAYCKAHGGGRRCLCLGCTKSAEGKTEYCIAHGGGRRCGHPDCTKAARGKSGLCIRHGGGKRCMVEGCTRSAEGQAGLCISHGGGRRCQHPGCNKGAQGSTMHCKAHGGGKRCVFVGCTKGAEGSTPLCKGHGGGKRCLFDGGGICPKSVHGGTDYCVAHGGGKRCAVPGCTKSARGRTDCCVRHGGGKRCRFENCGKSAQGSTDFCKAHGGGKRCTWGQGTCEKFARGKSGLCAAHGSMVQDKGKGGGMISPHLFQGLVSMSTMGSSLDNDHSSGLSAVSDCVESSENSGRRQLIPPQVLVPLSMKSSSSSSHMGSEKGTKESRSRSFDVPEGRVHGGGLMSLLGGDLKNAVDGIVNLEGVI
ncbi:uncharacterized protein LOC131242158 [Magnolia sinica]|uniref:uncharacterized protein LOC131242158 n=1 Tax=Magnolia sinica TaxID=86752 RepID=UPI00265967D1|nr:uncharacterized protein LOC131242158 [Magnolia sinica]XP_058096592.1 uncharacterized protein LOC131242158 [Magnolia sinica]